MVRKIAIVRSSFSQFGGVERVALATAQGLLQTGAQVTLVTLPGQKWPLSHPRLSVIPVGISRGHRLLAAWFFNQAVNKALSQTTFDVVLSLDKVTRFTHLHAGGGTHRTFLRLKNARSNLPARLLHYFSPFHRLILHLEKAGFENPLFQKARCNSTLVKKDLQSDYQVSDDRLVVIPSGIRWKDMQPVFDQREEISASLLERHGIDPKWRCLLFLGSGFRRKGLDIAIQGLSHMPADTHLLVVGKGSPKPFQRLLRHYALNKRVHFLGPQPQGWRYAACSKALVLPSHYDPFSGACAEGHAMGIPVLLTPTNGYMDRIIDNQNGILMNGALTDDSIREDFGRLSRLIAEPRWTNVQLRQHVQDLDDDSIMERVLTRFLNL